MKIYLIHSILTTRAGRIRLFHFVRSSFMNVQKTCLVCSSMISFFSKQHHVVLEKFCLFTKGMPIFTYTHPPSPLKPNLSPKADYFHRNTSLKWSAESMRINTYITIMLNHAIRSFSTLMGVQGGALTPPPLSWVYLPNPRL